MKGLKKFKEHFPDFQGKKFGIYLVIFMITFLSMQFMHLLGFLVPRILPSSPNLIKMEPIIPILISITTISTGFGLVYGIWGMKDSFLKTDKERAYQKGFLFAAVGIPIVLSVPFHNFLPPSILIPFSPRSTLTATMETSFSQLLLGSNDWIAIPRIILGVMFLVLGFAVVVRAVQIFGIDYMGLVYLYYPEDSEIQDNEIYSSIRHPAYHAIIMIMLGLFFIHFTTYQLVDLFCTLIGFTIHINFVEEKELVERFGDGYKNYKKSVPALFPKDLKIYLRFILGR